MITQLKQYGLAKAHRRLSDLARRALAQPRLATFAQKLILVKVTEQYRVSRRWVLVAPTGGDQGYCYTVESSLT